MSSVLCPFAALGLAALIMMPIGMTDDYFDFGTLLCLALFPSLSDLALQGPSMDIVLFMSLVLVQLQ